MEDNKFNESNSLFLIFSWQLKKAYENNFLQFGKEFNLTKNEIDVLLFLENNPSFDTAKDIAKYRSMSKSMISKSVTSLYQRGYLDYEVSKKDKRYMHLKINPTAKFLVDELLEIQIDFFTKLFQKITVDEQKLMEKILTQMYNNILLENKD